MFPRKAILMSHHLENYPATIFFALLPHQAGLYRQDIDAAT